MLKDIVSVFVSKFALITSSFLVNIYIAKVLGPNGNGEYALLLLFCNALATFAALGIPIALNYTLAGEIKNEKIVVFAYRYQMVSFGLIAIPLTLFLEGVAWVSIFLLLLTASKLLLNINQSVYYGRKKFKKHSVEYGIFSLLSASVVIYYAKWQSDINATSILALQSILTLIFVLMQFFIVVRGKTKFDNTVREVYQDIELRRFVKFGLNSFPNNVIAFLINRVDLFIITALLTIENVGIFSLAVSVIEAMSLASVSIASVYFNRVASSNGGSRYSNDKRILMLSMLVAIVSVFVYLALIKGLMSKYLGAEYYLAFELIDILLVAILINSITKNLAMIYVGINKAHYNTVSAVLVLTFGSVLSYVLVSNYGIFGAAFSFVCANLINLLVKLVQYRQVM